MINIGLRKLLAVICLSVFLMQSALAFDSVNINTANVSSISEALNGVGETRAKAIVEYRDQNGPFSSVDQLINVKGIGAKLVEKNREFILLK